MNGVLTGSAGGLIEPPVVSGGAACSARAASISSCVMVTLTAMAADSSAETWCCSDVAARSRSMRWAGASSAPACVLASEVTFYGSLVWWIDGLPVRRLILLCRETGRLEQRVKTGRDDIRRGRRAKRRRGLHQIQRPQSVARDLLVEGDQIRRAQPSLGVIAGVYAGRLEQLPIQRRLDLQRRVLGQMVGRQPDHEGHRLGVRAGDRARHLIPGVARQTRGHRAVANLGHAARLAAAPLPEVLDADVLQISEVLVARDQGEGDPAQSWRGLEVPAASETRLKWGLEVVVAIGGRTWRGLRLWLFGPRVLIGRCAVRQDRACRWCRAARVSRHDVVLVQPHAARSARASAGDAAGCFSHRWSLCSVCLQIA